MSKLDIRTLVRAAKDARQRAANGARLILCGRGDSLADLTVAVTRGAPLEAGQLPSIEPDGRALASLPLRAGDVLVVAAQGLPWEALAAAVAAARGARARLVVALPPAWSGDAGAAKSARSAGAMGDESVAFDGGLPLEQSPLAAGIARAAGDGGMVLARDLPALRSAVVARIIRRAAAQNGAVGVVVWVPGADMPIMTVNQVRMVLDIAAAYGQEIGADRAVEVLSVVGAGFGLRAAARQVLRFVPVLGWAVKGAMGYTGTAALGRAAVQYFEAGSPATPERVKGISDQVVRLTRGLVRRGRATA